MPLQVLRRLSSIIGHVCNLEWIVSFSKQNLGDIVGNLKHVQSFDEVWSALVDVVHDTLNLPIDLSVEVNEGVLVDIVLDALDLRWSCLACNPSLLRLDLKLSPRAHPVQCLAQVVRLRTSHRC